MQQKIFDLLLQKEEVGWKDILYDLINTEQMDPWDINISLLAKKYIELIKGMQEHDLVVSGKVLLAAALLLKIKSAHLIDNDIARLDNLINLTEEEMGDELWEEIKRNGRGKQEQYILLPRNPQPRNRKVSINDLVNALQRAMSSKKIVLEKMRPVKFNLPQGNVDIMAAIEEIYLKVVYYSNKNSQKDQEKLAFTKLLPPRAGKQEKVYTFIPLLHLENLQKVALQQEKPFAEIWIELSGKKGAK